MNESLEWSLKKEIKKRKTQTILRALEAREVQTPLLHESFRIPARLTPTPADLTPPRPLSPITPASRRATQAKRATRPSVGWTYRQKRTAILATILIVTVCLITASVAVSLPSSQSGLPPLPTTSTGDFIHYLGAAGFPVTNLRAFTVPNAEWNAQEEIQFEVHREGEMGLFVVLSYASPAQAGLDAFKASYDHKFQQWDVIQISNILLLTSPETSGTLNAGIAEGLAQYLVLPYRSFLSSTAKQK